MDAFEQTIDQLKSRRDPWAQGRFFNLGHVI
jgi:hypothetical protein